MNDKKFVVETKLELATDAVAYSLKKEMLLGSPVVVIVFIYELVLVAYGNPVVCTGVVANCPFIVYINPFTTSTGTSSTACPPDKQLVAELPKSSKHKFMLNDDPVVIRSGKFPSKIAFKSWSPYDIPPTNGP